MTKRFFPILGKDSFSKSWVPGNLPDGPVVDLGCGNGIISRLLAMHTNKKLICVDRRQGAIDATREKMRGLRCSFLLNDVCCLGIKDNTCSLVFASRIFSNVENKKLLLKEAVRVLKLGGYLVIVDYQKCLNFFKKTKLPFSDVESPKNMIAMVLKKGI